MRVALNSSSKNCEFSPVIGHCGGHCDSVSDPCNPRAWGSGECARCVEQQLHQQNSTSVQSDSGSCAWESGVCARVVLNSSSRIVIVAPVLGGPECGRALCWKAAAEFYSGSCAWGSGVCARCVEQQQQQQKFYRYSVRPCVPCVPCVSRLPPVSFYRYMYLRTVSALHGRCGFGGTPVRLCRYQPRVVVSLP